MVEALKLSSSQFIINPLQYDRKQHKPQQLQKQNRFIRASRLFPGAGGMVWKQSGSRASLLVRRSSCNKESHYSAREEQEEDEDYANWQKVQLVERFLQVAVVDEDYGEAARLRDVLDNMKSKLTTTEQILLVNARFLKNEDPNRRIRAAETLGDIGDKRVFPMLSAGLRDENELVVIETEKAMWRIFMRSGRNDVDKRIQDGVSKMVAKDGLVAARDIFTEVIKMAPWFAEGYNKRATVHYLLQDYHKSIEDCHKTLKLNPYHFAALSGLGLCYVAIQDPESALCWLEKAYAMHPGLVQINKYIKVLKKKIKEKRTQTEDQ